MSDVLLFNPNAPASVTLTPAAFSYLKNTIEKRGSGKGLRLSVKKTGCSGYSYVVDILDETTADDYIFPLQDELVIAVAKSFLDIVQGTRIDYVQKGLNGGFEFDNPNQKGICGCGESFTV